LEEDSTRRNSNLLIELLEARSLLEEIPPSLLEEYLLEAQNYAVFISPTSVTSRREKHSPAVFPLSPFNLTALHSLWVACPFLARKTHLSFLRLQEGCS
ncbi:MAG: hypothetical protein GPJ50_03170, partial [Candidatus Heimdallarchaeota archaeon]|nr:hypothetical protein [Candidatus Heimdallarchaeota archaeon]